MGHPLGRRILDQYRCLKFRVKLARQPQKRIEVGASGRFDRGWLPTNKDFLNLLKPTDWARLFPPASLDAILAEHVWEHLTEQEGLIAASICFKYLKPGGYLRVAVPDGLHPDPEYIEWVRVGGVGTANRDHKVLYTYQSLKALKASDFASFCMNTLMRRGCSIMKSGILGRAKFSGPSALTGEINLGS